MKWLTKTICFLLTAFMLAAVSCKTDDNTGTVSPSPATQTEKPSQSGSSDMTPADTQSEQAETCTITFNKNADDATGATKAVSGKKNESVTLTENGFARAGYGFGGWNTLANGTGANYSNKASFKLTKSLTLYAMWFANTNTAYTVRHLFQNEAKTGYETNAGYPDETQYGTTGKATEAKAKSVDGFTAQTVTQATIKGDGSTVVEIKYDRKSVQPTTDPTPTPPVASQYAVEFQQSANSYTYSNGVYTMQIASATAAGVEWQNQIFITNPNSGLGLVAGDTIRVTVTAKANKPIEAFFFKDEFNKNSYIGIDNASTDKSLAANVEKTFELKGEVKDGYSDSMSRLVIDLRGNQADTTLVLSNITVEKVVVKSSIDASGSTDGTSTGTAKTSFTASSPADESSFTSLVWADEFEGSSLKTENWQLEVGPKGTWYNNELQGYTNGDNVEVRDGCLVITAKEDLTSTRMKSQDKKYFTYGKLTARIKMSNGHGSWPAFWMLGQNIGTNEWPRCGEIDIMEHANSDTYIYNTLHWNTAGWQSGAAATHAYYGTKTHETAQVAVMDVSEWHEYTCVWTESSIKMYVDGVQTFVMSIAGSDAGIAAFHKPFFVLFNFAMGGDFMGEYNPGTFTNLPWQMYVDYIRLYQ